MHHQSWTMFESVRAWFCLLRALIPISLKQLINAELLEMVVCQRQKLSLCECGVLADLVVTFLNFAH